MRAHIRWRRLQMLPKQLVGAALKGKPPREQMKGRDPHGIQVSTTIDIVEADLLRCHVLRCSAELIRRSDFYSIRIRVLGTTRTKLPSNSKIEDLHKIWVIFGGRQEQIAQFDITVDDGTSVGMTQSA